MPQERPANDGPAIGLAEMIESLRVELQSALERAKKEAVVFEVDKVELEQGTLHFGRHQPSRHEEL